MIVESKEAIKVEKTTLDKKFHLISYGCQMNFADSEVVASILESIGYSNTNTIENSDLILLNTCSIREKAEQTIRKKLSSIDHLKKKNRNLKIGVLGCMAERLKEKFLIEEKIVDLVVGPDAYRDLPNLLKEVNSGNDAVDSMSSRVHLQNTLINKAGDKGLSAGENSEVYVKNLTFEQNNIAIQSKDGTKVFVSGSTFLNNN